MSKSLICAAVMLSAASFAQARIPADIMLDGYCEGMHFTKAGLGLLVAMHTGCTDGTFYGFAGHLRGSPPGTSYMLVDSTYGPVYSWVISGDGTWYLAESDTGTFINSGTWH